MTDVSSIIWAFPNKSSCVYASATFWISGYAQFSFLFYNLKAILSAREEGKKTKKSCMQIKVNLCSSYWRHKNWSENALYSSRNNEFKTKRELNKQKRNNFFFTFLYAFEFCILLKTSFIPITVIIKNELRWKESHNKLMYGRDIYGKVIITFIRSYM